MKGSLLKKTLSVIVAIVLMIGISFGTATIIRKKGSIPASTTITNGLSAYELAVENGYKGTVQEWLESLSGKSAYEIAVDGGYKGTEAEWTTALTKLANSDAVGIKTASFNSKGELVLTLSDETTINLGKAVGVDGVNGKDGINGQDGKTGADGKDGTNGKDGADGQDGADGKDGPNGKDGVNGKNGIGISNVDINDSGELVLSFSDEKTVNLGKVVGTSGLNGLSAYEIAVLTGKTTATSEAEWIENLKGAKGDKGDKGDTGSAGDTPYIKDGNWWIGTTDTGIAAQGPQGQAGDKGDKGEKGDKGNQGDKGDKGDKGDAGSTGAAGLTPHIDTNGNWWIGTTDTGIRANGKSAYEVALENNPNLTYEQWTESLKGATGANGKSAYELAVETGLVSSTVTVENWLASLKGANGEDGISPVVRINSTTNEWEISIDGGVNYTSTGVKATGEKGADGQNGAKGEKGADGISPKIRINSDNEWEVSIDNGETYTSTGVKATGANGKDGVDGDDGLTPEIKDGVWWIGERNTGIIAEGIKGENGKDAVTPQIRIDAATNMWEISSDGGKTFTTTNVKATGDKGATGAKGQDGESAYEMAKRLGLTNADSETTFIESLKGENGISPEIGENGNWWIGTTDTGVKAMGEKGEDGDTPYINNEGFWCISETVTTFKAAGTNGNDGDTPYINADGFWVIGDQTTTVKAKGINGTTPHISDDGYWYIGTEKTTQKAQGEKGADGVGIDNITLSDGVMTITLTNSEKVYKFENLKGADGITPQLIIEDGKWKVSYDNGTSYTELGNATGADGITPSITEDGYWKFGDTVTPYKAVAVDGKNGITPQLKIENDKWYVSYDKGTSYTELGAAKGDKGDDGDNGISPTIKEGYWYIGDQNTNVRAQGIDGTNGTNGITPILKIENDYWYVSYDNGNNYTSFNTKAVGEDGQKGDKGITPLLKIGEDNYWYVSYDDGENYSSLNVKATGANGTNGSNGQNGADGTTPMLKIGEDNYWYVSYDKGNSYSSLNVKATGADGKNGADGKTPEIIEGYWYVDGKSTGVRAEGVDGVNGKTPYIQDGTWWIDGVDTEVPVTGQNGANGENGKTPEIGSNGNWWIDGADTGKTAIATDGKDGDGIVGITVNENNYLVIDMKYGEDIVIEKSIVGPAGKDGKNGADGKNGNGIKSITLTDDYKLVIETDTGTTTLDSIRGEKGEKGTGIKSIALNDNFELVFTMDDEANTAHTVTGSLKGADGVGVEEVKIEDGILKIKYTNSDTFVELGKVKGEKGDTGATGPQGPQGPAGNDGVDGDSTYDIAVKNGFEGSETEWLASLAGRGIVKTEISGTNLIIYYTDNTTETHDLSEIISDPNEKEILVFSELEDGTYGVMAGGMAKYEAVIEIPETYNEIAVTQILDDGFKNLTTLQKVIIPDSITVIGINAFYNCIGLDTVSQSDNLLRIEPYAFYGCQSLETIVIPDSITYIGNHAFYQAGLTSVDFPMEKNWKISTFKGSSYNYTANTLIYDSEYRIRFCRNGSTSTVDYSTTFTSKKVPVMLTGKFTEDYMLGVNSRSFTGYMYEGNWTYS